LERRGVERTRRMRLVMFREEQWPLEPAELLPNQLAREQLLLHPDRHRRHERTPSARRNPEVTLDEPLELQQRLVVEADVVDVRDIDAAFAKAVRDGVRRKARVVLFPREPLLL